MPKCDICNKKTSLFDIFWLSNGKCCGECKEKGSLANLREFKSTIEDVKKGFLQEESFLITVNKLNEFCKEQFTKIGLVYEGCETKNAIHTNVIDGSYMTVYENCLFFIEDGSVSYRKCGEYMRNTDLKKAEAIKFDDLEILKIPIEQIEYFCREGDKQYTTEVTGGGGGGSSLSGAIVGGLIAGGAGAVIGSRKEVNPISSSVKVHDTSKSFILYRNSNDELTTMEFDTHDVYNYLLRKIPQKDIRTVQLKNTNNQPTSQIDEIRKFKELLDDGIITEEEFQVKKKQLLGI